MPIPALSSATLDAAGWLSGARQLPSPNCDPRPQGTAIELIVIHNISLPPGVFEGDAVIDLFTNRLDWDAHPYYQGIRGLKVSAHFFIRRDGTLIQFVPCALRAWHAGASKLAGTRMLQRFFDRSAPRSRPRPPASCCSAPANSARKSSSPCSDWASKSIAVDRYADAPACRWRIAPTWYRHDRRRGPARADRKGKAASGGAGNRSDRHRHPARDRAEGLAEVIPTARAAN
jgi:hypothetical protein